MLSRHPVAIWQCVFWSAADLLGCRRVRRLGLDLGERLFAAAEPWSCPAHWGTARARTGGPGRVVADELTAEGSLAAAPAAVI